MPRMLCLILRDAAKSQRLAMMPPDALHGQELNRSASLDLSAIGLTIKNPELCSITSEPKVCVLRTVLAARNAAQQQACSPIHATGYCQLASSRFVRLCSLCCKRALTKVFLRVPGPAPPQLMAGRAAVCTPWKCTTEHAAG